MRHRVSLTPLSLCLYLCFAATLLVSSVATAELSCDHVIAVAETQVDGGSLGVQAGETICIEAGERPFLRFYNIVGTQNAPVVITNMAGVVQLDNSDRGYGLTFEGSSFFQLTGTGSDEPYGFSVRAARTGPDYSASCVVVSGLSTDYELDHLEIFDCGFAGMNLKTEPTCDLTANLGHFVQKNSRIHHNYIHDTGGEGIYFGSTGYGGRTYTCDGTATTLYPHTHEGVWIHDNRIFDTAWDGLQVGVSPKDCFVYRNSIERVGLAQVEYQMQGIQIGGASRCTVSQNYLAHGPAVGIIALDNQDTIIENNVVYDFVDGIYLNDRDNEESSGAQYVIAHNTVVSASDRGVTIYGERSQNDSVLNNLIVGSGGQALGIGQTVDAENEGNLVLGSLAEAHFVDSGAENFALLEASPAVNAGFISAVHQSLTDFLGGVRDDSPDVGAFEFGAQPDPNLEPILPGSPDGIAGGANADGPDAGGKEASDPSGGCSCSEAGGPGVTMRHTSQQQWLWTLATLLLLLWRRVRISSSSAQA